MKFNKISLAIATVAAGIAFTGCNMYGKFKMLRESAGIEWDTLDEIYREGEHYEKI